MPGTRIRGIALIAIPALLYAANGRASNCNVTSVGITPLNDLGTGLYLGQFQGGLYPGGSNAVPAAHQAEGVLRAQGVQPLDAAGNPSPTGKYVLLSIGMSNTTQEFCAASGGQTCASWSFMGQAAASPLVNHTTLQMVNGALGGQTASTWDSPTDTNYNRIATQELPAAGVTEAQVQTVWVKVANATPTVSLPAANADAYALLGSMGNIARTLRVRYPNVRVVFFSSRIYAGYASSSLNPEPYAYESALAVKWLIAAQINQMSGGPIDPIAGDLNYNTVAPWIAWGPYLWADGLNARSDGLIWACADLDPDGTHPSMSGEQKVGGLLLDFMLSSPFAAPWFAAGTSPVPFADCNSDGHVDLADYATLASCLVGPESSSGSGCACTHSDADTDTDLRDAAAFMRVFSPAPVNQDPAVDDFERPLLGENWLVTTGSVAIIGSSDMGVPSGSGGAAVWRGSSFAANQFCEGVMSSSWNSSNSLQVSARVGATGSGGYSFRRNGTGPTSYLLVRNTSPAATLASGSGPSLAAGSILRIEVQGSSVRGLINGSVILTATDGTFSAGSSGVTFGVFAGAPAAYLESWRGGSLPP